MRDEIIPKAGPQALGGPEQRKLVQMSADDPVDSCRELENLLNEFEFAPAAAFGFVSGSSTHAHRLATIRQTWQEGSLMIDTHTADGLKVAREHLQAGVPMIVLETALPAKFAATIREATGLDPEPPAALRGIESLPKRFTVMAPDAAAVKHFIKQHCAHG